MKKLFLVLTVILLLSACGSSVKEYRSPLYVKKCQTWEINSQPKYCYIIRGGNDEFVLFSNNKYEVGKPIFLIQ